MPVGDADGGNRKPSNLSLYFANVHCTRPVYRKDAISVCGDNEPEMSIMSSVRSLTNQQNFT